MLRRLLLAAALLAPLSAHATSTVNPTQPAQKSDLVSATVRNNFLATYNDINNILGKFAGTVAPSNQSAMQDWVDTTASPVYKFKFWNPTTSTWVQWGTLNINTGAFSAAASSATFAATAPITVNFSGGVATYGISLDSNFTVSGGALALASVASGSLLANCGASTAEPTACTWGAFADRNISSSNGILPYRTGGSWSTASTGITGHVLPFLDSTTLNFSGVLTSYAGGSSPSTALTGTLFRGVALDGTVARVQLDSFGTIGAFSCVRADGTLAVPTTLQANDQFCGFNAHGYNGAAYVGPQASVRFFASQNWSVGANGTYARIAVTASGATTLTDQFSLENDGGVTLGTLVGVANSKGQGTINAQGLYVNGVAVATGSISSSTTNAIAYYSGATTISGATSANNAVVSTNGSGVPQVSTTLPSGISIPAPVLTSSVSATGLSVGTCSAGLGLDSGNSFIKTSCPGAASSIQDGTTSITSGVAGTILINNGGTLGHATRAQPVVCEIILTTATTCNNGGTSANNGTYTTPSGALYLKITMIGGGGSGSGSATTGGGNGSAGLNTCWNTTGAACTSPVFQAGGGGAGSWTAGNGGAGGTVSGSGTCSVSVVGSAGEGSSSIGTSGGARTGGGGGGGAFLGGGGAGNVAGVTVGNAGGTNTGGGGQGGGVGVTSGSFTGSGGGGGAGCIAYITGTLASTYTYAVAGTTAGGTAGTNGAGGGGGAAGRAIVEAFFE